MHSRGSRPRRIALGVCGSIAAYKACDLVRKLTKAEAEVKVVLTPSAAKFVTPLTLSVLSKNPVYQDPFDPAMYDMAHLSLASWADLILVAPATADLMARCAGGRSGGLLESLILSARGAVAFCPAMDAEMWAHPATQENAAKLKSYGYSIWGPERGPLASGRVGMGRLMEPADIVSRVLTAGKAARGR